MLVKIGCCSLDSIYHRKVCTILKRWFLTEIVVKVRKKSIFTERIVIIHGSRFIEEIHVKISGHYILKRILKTLDN